MGNTVLFIELVAFFGLFMALAFWEYRKTQKLVEQDRETTADKASQTDAASETAAEP